MNIALFFLLISSSVFYAMDIKDAKKKCDEPEKMTKKEKTEDWLEKYAVPESSIVARKLKCNERIDKALDMQNYISLLTIRKQRGLNRFGASESAQRVLSPNYEQQLLEEYAAMITEYNNRSFYDESQAVEDRAAMMEVTAALSIIKYTKKNNIPLPSLSQLEHFVHNNTLKEKQKELAMKDTLLFHKNINKKGSEDIEDK